MSLQCPQCQAGILIQQIDQGLQATCQQCGVVFSLAEQLEGLLAYHRPQKTEIPDPPNLWLEYLPEETLQVRLPQPLQLRLPRPLAALAQRIAYSNRAVITANRKRLMIHDRPLPGLSFNKKQFEASQIEQLYLKKSFPLKSRPRLELGALLAGDQAERLNLELWALLAENRE